MRDGRRDAARVGRNDPCLAQLRRHAHTFDELMGIVRRHSLTAGAVRAKGENGGYAWECLSCGNVEFTAERVEPRDCTACYASHRWAPMVPALPAQDPDAEEIASKDFALGAWWWVARWLGRGGAQLVFCSTYTRRERLSCGDCTRCPEALREMVIAKVRAEYEWVAPVAPAPAKEAHLTIS